MARPTPTILTRTGTGTSTLDNARGRRTTAGAIVMDLSVADSNALVGGSGHVYVIIVTQPLTRQHKDSFVMISSSPFRAIAQRNLTQSPYREMRDKVPYLYPEFVAGPFPMFALAVDYADQLVVGRRGLPSKVKHGCTLALTFQVPCYHIAVRPSGGLEAFLRQHHAPPSYLSACARLAEATGVLQTYCGGADEGTPLIVAAAVAAILAVEPASETGRALLAHIFSDADTIAHLAKDWPAFAPQPLSLVLRSVGQFWKDARLFAAITPVPPMDERAETLLLGRGRSAVLDCIASVAADPGAARWLKRVAEYLRRHPRKLTLLLALTETLDLFIDRREAVEAEIVTDA